MIIAAIIPCRAALTFEPVYGIPDARIQRVAVAEADASFIAAASDNVLYISEDAGRNFHKAAVLKDEQIRHLFIDRRSSPAIYLAGSRHCYRIRESTEKIFSADENERINFAIEHKGRIYLGTTTGLYHADQTLLDWRAEPGLRNKEIYSIDAFGEQIYLACSDGAYLLRTDGMLRRLHALRDHNDRESFNLIRIDPLTPSRLWLSTPGGLFSSSNWGDTWKEFFPAGADNVSIRSMAQAPLNSRHLYLCTDSGLFRTDTADGTSRSLFSGLATSHINWIDFTADGRIYLATDKGLYQSVSSEEASLLRNRISIIADEPAIHQVQEAAMRYNSVHPDKVRRWRSRLKYRALFPEVRIDYDNTIRGGSLSGKYYFAEGPYEWGISLSWDMGDLIWNSYEDDIDNRSKLTTQLRMDILDEVTRLYYERLRLKQEVASLDPGTEESALKELRLMELTAAIDSYTGGCFRKSQEHVNRH